MLHDDLGAEVPLIGIPKRIVSLVPSLTEALEATQPGIVSAATDWCTHPADLDCARIRGTKNPNVDAIIAMAPDLVIANEEENREVDVLALRAAGVAVYVTRIETVHQALESMTRLLAAIGRPDPQWLVQAREEWTDPEPVAPEPIRAITPIWRKPWMFVGRDTYTGDLLAVLGVGNPLAQSDTAAEGRYPKVELENLPEADIVLLPDEPYVFTEDDGPEAFALPSALVSGRRLTWYGPAMVGAAAELRDAIRAALAKSTSNTQPRT